MPYVLPYQPTTSDKLRDALIAALPQIALAVATKGVSLLGSVPTSPTAQHPGTFNFPPGSQSPGEAAQIGRLGGVPTNAGILARSTQVPGTGGINYQPPTRLGLTPDLSQLLQQAQLQKAQADVTQIPVEARRATALATLAERAAKGEITIDPTTGLPIMFTTSGAKSGPQPPKSTDTEAYRQSLQNAVTAVRAGKDRKAVKQKLLDAFPDKALEIEQDFALTL